MGIKDLFDFWDHIQVRFRRCDAEWSIREAPYHPYPIRNDRVQDFHAGRHGERGRLQAVGIWVCRSIDRRRLG